MNQDHFQHLTEPHRHEIVVHCYRILGSLEDAEDAAQETFLRAWLRLDALREQTSLRAWLYKIATHFCLDLLATRRRRLLPGDTYSPADPHLPLPELANDPSWLEPLPDTYLARIVASPEARYETRESVQLAFLAALQKLPGKQRAILLLRDVLDYTAREVADLLGLSVPAVNSAVQRGRASMRQWQAHPHADMTDDRQMEALLLRYIEAWEAEDAASLIELLREDAVLTMPPLPAWYQGRTAIKTFLELHLFQATQARTFRVIPTKANACPALAIYQRNATGNYLPVALQILTLDKAHITRVDDFLLFGARWFSYFDLPQSLDR